MALSVFYVSVTILAGVLLLLAVLSLGFSGHQWYKTRHHHSSRDARIRR
jgi:hypothetical protein